MSNTRFGNKKKPVKVICWEVHGGTMVFDSIGDCVGYFRAIGQKYLYSEMVARRIVSGEPWSYKETYFLNGQKITDVHEFFFDELADGDITTAINTGNAPVRRNKPTKTSTEDNGQLKFW